MENFLLKIGTHLMYHTIRKRDIDFLTNRTLKTSLPVSTYNTYADGILIYLMLNKSSSGYVTAEVTVETKHLVNTFEPLAYSMTFYTAVLHCKFSRTLSREQPGLMISLPDFSQLFEKLQLAATGHNISEKGSSLQAYWIKNNFKYSLAYRYARTIVPLSLCSVLSAQLNCYNYSNFATKMRLNHFYTVFGKPVYGALKMKEIKNGLLSGQGIDSLLSEPIRTRVSWGEARSLCEASGGYLPVLRSKEEEDEIISILLSGLLSHVELLFIGLVYHSAKVIVHNYALVCHFCLPANLVKELIQTLHSTRCACCQLHKLHV